MKYLKFGKVELAACAALLVAICLRLLLIGQHWPMLDSDEGTMGLIARHIAYRGEHPIFFYGQLYMGVLQAYLGAFLFHLFGPSLFSLRLGLLLLNVLFLISLYLLVCVLYTRALALFAICLLTFGSYYMLEYQLHAYGGYPDILLCGTLALLIACSLAITSSTHVSLSRLHWRLLGYLAWGFVVGLGLWGDVVILPIALLSGLLILLFCWREILRIVPALCLLAGACLGALPLIRYNLFAPSGQDTLSVIWNIQHAGGTLHYDWPFLLKSLQGAFLVSIPTITGNPFCPVSEEEALHDPTTPDSFHCALVHGVWSGLFLCLFLCALTLTLWAVWSALHRYSVRERANPAARQELARQCGRLFLLASGMLILYLFLHSNAPATWPAVESRYMISLWIALPAILWPLWQFATPKTIVGTTEGRLEGRLQPVRVRRPPDDLSHHGKLTETVPPTRLTILPRLRQIGSIILLACLLGVYLIGTAITLADAPRANADYQRYSALSQHLLSIGTTHIYTDYWTCDKLAFISQEQVICGVIDGNLQPSHNRDPRYYTLVSNDPHSAYVFRTDGQMESILQKIAQNPTHYRRYEFEGYVIYQPV